MNRNTLARAYAAQTTQPGRAPAEQASPRSGKADHPAAAAGSFAPARPATGVAQPPAEIEDALLIAVRRSLASCRDSSQLRMLAAFEARR